MRKSAITVLIPVIMLMVFSGSAWAASIVKVGIVDFQKALNATSEGVAAKENLRAKHQIKQDKIDVMKAELDLLEEKLKSPVISEVALAELKDRYRKEKTELIEYATRAKEEEDRENQLLSARILEGLIKIASRIGSDEEFTVILEKSGSGVVYQDDNLDLTDRVIREYNQEYQSEKSQ